ncbi:DUF1616 domain-containing protein [Haladaptatus sp. DFWS20]|uniref:DUF1616 domain-containing protein n=1 Tax=Haladaptatus sp. DFWS20 TaxID=3403467 RepID=UPI003EB91DF5
MSRDVDPWLLLPDPVRRLPADLVFIICFVIATCVVVLVPGLNDTPIRAVLGLPFVLFPPGYAFIAALFPEAGGFEESDRQGDASETDGRFSRFNEGIDGLERVALSFGTSIAIVPLIGLVLNFTPWGIRLVPVLLSISGFTLLMTVIAAVRRWNLPEDERFSVPYKQWSGDARSELFEPDTRADAALNVVLVVSVVLASASVGYAVLVPNQGESFSEFYLLTENDDGELVADGYPTNFTQGERKPVIVGIENHEHERTNYSAVVLLQNVTTRNNSTVVNDEQQLQRFQTTLGQNETWRTTHNITATMTGTRLRLIYLLYKGDVPRNPTADNAYRELHLWVNVTANGSSPAQVTAAPTR